MTIRSAMTICDSDSYSMLIVADLLVLSLAADTGQRLIKAGVDAAGSSAVTVTDEEGGNPLRCCLRDSLPGERLVLAAVQPPGPAGPYLETGPVFVHAGVCDGPADELPSFWATRSQVLRSYDNRGWILGGEVATGKAEIAAAAARAVRSSEVAFVQVRNIVAGCYMATVFSPDAPLPSLR